MSLQLQVLSLWQWEAVAVPLLLKLLGLMGMIGSSRSHMTATMGAFRDAKQQQV
jgi:hypothetical protein